MFSEQSTVEIRLLSRSVQIKLHFTKIKALLYMNVMNVKVTQMIKTFMGIFCFILQWCITPLCTVNKDFKYIYSLVI